MVLQATTTQITHMNLKPTIPLHICKKRVPSVLSVCKTARGMSKCYIKSRRFQTTMFLKMLQSIAPDGMKRELIWLSTIYLSV